jgi:hypothetical protein
MLTKSDRAGPTAHPAERSRKPALVAIRWYHRPMTLRAAATWLFGVFVTALALPLISANVRELARQRGWDTFLVRWWDALPEQWRDELRWERLQGLWWLWYIFGLSGGVALALWLTPFLSLGLPILPNEPPSLIDRHRGGGHWKGLAGMSWGIGNPAPIYLALLNFEWVNFARRGSRFGPTARG